MPPTPEELHQMFDPSSIPPPAMKEGASLPDFEYDHLPYLFVEAISRIKSLHTEAGQKVESVAQQVDGYIVFEHFGTAGIVWMSSALTAIVMIFKLSVAWLFLGLWYLSFLYTTNIARLRFRLQKEAINFHQTRLLESDTESIEWFNQLFTRWWYNYEPNLSQMLKETISNTLDTIKIPTIDELRIDKFTLGSQPPRIDGIRTFANTGQEVLILDFDLSFVPFDEDSISKRERMAKELRNLEVVLVAKLAGIPFPVSLKDVYFGGKLRLQFTFSNTWPHIKTLDLSFVQSPDLDFILKPLGADLSKVAGLGSFIKETVNSTLKTIIVNPVVFSLPLGEWLGENAGGTEEPAGVLRVMLYEAKGVKNVDLTGISDPAAHINLGGTQVARTRTLDNTLDPKWNQVHYLIIYKSSLTQTEDKSDELSFEVVHHNALGNKSLGTTNSLRLRQWIGITNDRYQATEEEKGDMVQEWGSPCDHFGLVWKQIYRDGKRSGSLRFDLTYFPVEEAARRASVSSSTSALPTAAALPVINEEPKPCIVTVTVWQAKELCSGGNGSVHVVGKYAGTEVVKTPVRKRTANPSFGTSHNFFTLDLARTSVEFTVFNRGNSIGTFTLDVAKLVQEPQNDWFKLVGVSGKIRVGVKAHTVDTKHLNVEPSRNLQFNPYGMVKLKIVEGSELPVPPGEIKGDPYVKVHLQGRPIGVTAVQEGTRTPHWHETFNMVCYSLSEALLLDVFDSNQFQKDTRLSRIEIPVAALVGGETDPATAMIISRFIADGMKVEGKGSNKWEIFVPLYRRSEDAADADKPAPEPAKTGVFNAAVRTAKSFGNIKSTITDITGGFVSRQKGFLKLQVELFPLNEDFIIDERISPSPRPRRPSVVNVNVLDSGKEKLPVAVALPAKDLLTIPEGVPLVIRSARDLVTQNRSGILRIKIESGSFPKKCQPYLEISSNSNPFFTTFPATESSTSALWLASTDQCVTDLLSLKFEFVLKNLVHSKVVPDDPVIGVWSGDLVDEFLGKGAQVCHFRPPRENASKFAMECSALIQCAFFPIAYVGDHFGLDCGILHLDILGTRNLVSVDSNGLSDPYIIISQNGKQVYKTETIRKSLNPDFNESVDIEVYSRVRSTIYFDIKDFNQFSADATIGTFALDLCDTKADTIVAVDLPIEGKSGTLKLRYMFETKEMDISMMVNNDERLNTEVSGLGKIGKQITRLGTKSNLKLGLSGPNRPVEAMRLFSKPSFSRNSSSENINHSRSTSSLSGNRILPEALLGPGDGKEEKTGKGGGMFTSLKKLMKGKSKSRRSIGSHPAGPHESDRESHHS